MRLYADNIYRGSPQPTTEGYVRLLCPSDTEFIDTDYRYAEERAEREGREVARDRQPDKQTDRSRAC